MTTIKYQLSKSELFVTAIRRKLLRFGFIAAELSLLAAMLVNWFAGTRDSVIWLAGGFVFLPVFILGAISKAISSNPRLTAETTLTFDQSGLQLSTPGWKSELAWSVFRKWSESSEYFFLHLGETTATVFPKRAFAPPEADLFRSCAGQISQQQQPPKPQTAFGLFVRYCAAIAVALVSWAITGFLTVYCVAGAFVKNGLNERLVIISVGYFVMLALVGFIGVFLGSLRLPGGNRRLGSALIAVGGVLLHQCIFRGALYGQLWALLAGGLAAVLVFLIRSRPNKSIQPGKTT